MFTILFLTILGFLAGLAYVMIKRKIKPGNMLTATLLALLSAGIWKAFKAYSKTRGRGRHF
jgi:hypothetical protein